MNRPRLSQLSRLRPPCLKLRLKNLNVRRFGTGYWLGLIGSALIFLSFPALHPGRVSSMVFPADLCRCEALGLGTVLAFVGGILSSIGVVCGLSRRDQHQIVGGLLGLALSSAPFLWVVLGMPR